MATTADYLNELINQKNNLVTILLDAGASVPENATFNQLIPIVEQVLKDTIVTNSVEDVSYGEDAITLTLTSSFLPSTFVLSAVDQAYIDEEDGVILNYFVNLRYDRTKRTVPHVGSDAVGTICFETNENNVSASSIGALFETHTEEEGYTITDASNFQVTWSYDSANKIYNCTIYLSNIANWAPSEDFAGFQYIIY